MPRAALLPFIAALAACAGGSRATTDTPMAATSRAPTTVMPGQAHAMLERVEGEDTRYVELPPAPRTCPSEPIDDDDIPSVDRGRTRGTNMDSGDESLDDKVLLLHLDTATAHVLECVTRAACYGESVATGEIDFAFEVNPAGKVRSVDVQPSADLDHGGVAACARRAIYETRFPAYDGADMIVSYRLEID